MAKEEMEQAKEKMLNSSVELLKDSSVTPGRYLSVKYKQHDPYTNTMFYQDRPVFVAGVTKWLETQVLAGVLVKVSDVE